MSCLRIPRTNCLLFSPLKNILKSNLNFSTSYGRLTDLKSLFGLLLVSFILLGENISLKYLLIGGGVWCQKRDNVANKDEGEMVTLELIAENEDKKLPRKPQIKSCKFTRFFKNNKNES